MAMASSYAAGGGTTADEKLRVEGLSTDFHTKAGVVHAVSDVSFTLRRGEILGLVGESGSGKTMTGLSILRLVDPPGQITAGRVLLEGRDLLGLPERQLRAVRGARISMVFQDPTATLHPLLRVSVQMADAVTAHRKVNRTVLRRLCAEALARMHIPSPEEFLDAYPHQLSGGMRQRVAIAIAMLNAPAVLIADEPTTALDVTTQAQILSEARQLCHSTGTAMLWITHDLAVVAQIADRVAVMYAGEIVETGLVRRILDQPRHPYTAGLLEAVPSRQMEAKRLRPIPGDVVSAWSSQGCRFAARCSRATELCLTTPPVEQATGDGGSVRCHHPLVAEVPARRPVRVD